MDWAAVKYKSMEVVKKYKYVLLVLALGMVLMALPEGSEKVEELPGTTVETKSISDELEEILGQIDGVGKVKVLLTESAGAETLYQTDEDSDAQSIRIETVIVSNADRAEEGLVKQVNPPVWQGAIVVCQGAERPAVRLSVVEAVSNVTGISTNRITVLKMK